MVASFGVEQLKVETNGAPGAHDKEEEEDCYEQHLLNLQKYII